MGLTRQQWWPVRCFEYEKLIHGCSEHGFPDSDDFSSVPHSVPISQNPRSTKIKINKVFRYNSRFRVCYPNALQSADSFDPKIRCQGSYVGYRFGVEHEWSRRPILRGNWYDVCMAPNNMICCPLSGVVNVLLNAKGNDGFMHSLHWNFVGYPEYSRMYAVKSIYIVKCRNPQTEPQQRVYISLLRSGELC